MTVRMHIKSENGLGLIEALIAMLVLTVGAVGMASTFLYGMQSATSAPNELVATQKATEMIESVFAARDAHTITWAQLRNNSGGGVFLTGEFPVKTAGNDGILLTGDDGEEVETITLPGPDQDLSTPADNRVESLGSFTRKIEIADLAGQSSLRVMTVTVTYPSGSIRRTYSVTAYISAFA